MGNTVNNGEKKSQKTIFVIRYFHPFIGGLEKKTFNLASALIERGERIEIITSRFYTSWPERELVKNVPVYRLPSPRIKVLGAVVFLASLCWYLFNQRARIRIIHTFQLGYSSAAAIIMGKLLSKPTVLNLACSGSGGDISRNRRTPWGIAFLVLCRLASRIVVLNKNMHQELRAIRYDNQHIVWIPNGVNLAIYHNAADRKSLRKQMGIDSKKVIIYTGRLSAPQKMLDFLIFAYARLRTPLPASLIIIGDGPEKARLQRIMKQYKLEDSIRLIPAVEEVAPFLQSADVFVMPSRFEGLSNAILEAMACGLPVIATRVEGNTDLIEDGINGLLITPGDESGLVNALTLLLTRPEKAAALGRQARQTVCNSYDLQDIVGKYSSLYNSLSSA
jgi:glycosyltransferase involved in cell wall biosynthesis